jgi:hypothetical protein
MESFEIESDFKSFQENLKALPNFYIKSYGHLNFKHEKNKNDFFHLSSEEISDIIFVLNELNKAIQINIDEICTENCEEIISILRKSSGQPHLKSVNHTKAKKSIFKPLKKPKKIFLKVLRDDSPSKDTQTTNCNSKNSKKTIVSNISLKNNNMVNITEKISDETNK